MTFALGTASRKKLEGVDPRLVRVVERAIELTSVDFKVVEGVRTAARQRELYAQGRTKPGKVVTWTLKSRHIPDPKTGLGRAVDLLPAPYDWKDLAPFTLVAHAMLRASQELGIPIRWGANWDGDDKIREKGETDNPHFELA